MNHNKIIAMLAGAVFLLTGCIKEELPVAEGGSVDGSMDGTTRIALLIDEAELITTRSVASENECKINDAYLLVFSKDQEDDTSVNYKYKNGEWVNPKTHIKLNNNTDVKTPVITTELAINEGDSVVVLLNTGVSGIPGRLTVGETTTSQLNELFPTMSWNLNPNDATIFGQGMPMSGKMKYVAPKTDGTGGAVCKIKRSVAKIQLKIDIATGDDITKLVTPASVKWAMYNVLDQTRGAVFGVDGEITTREGLQATDFGKGVFAKTEVTQGQAHTQAFYMPEYPSATKAKEAKVLETKFSEDRSCMIIEVVEDASKGYYRYYRIDLYDHTKEKFIDIRRNTHILVKITKVKTAGYLTPEEALANPGSNLEYEIVVSGENDNIVISNGQYGLSLEYDQLIIFGEIGVEYTLGKVRFIDIAGSGLPETNIIESGDTNILTLTGATTVSTEAQDIKLKIKHPTNEFDIYDFEHIDIKVGNIRKRIFVFLFNTFQCHHLKRMPMLMYYDFSTTTMGWIREEEGIDISIKPNYGIEGDPLGLEISCADNIIPENAWEMSDPAAVPIFRKKHAEGYFTTDYGSSTGAGRTKLIITQMAPEYIGWFGGAPDNSGQGRYSKRLIGYSLEPAGTHWWGFDQSDIARSKESGLDNSKEILAHSNPSGFFAFTQCLILNDLDGSNGLDPGEPINWYLPAQNQLMSIFVVKEGLEVPFLDNRYYWSSTQRSYANGWLMHMDEGSLRYSPKNEQHSVRCVRDLDY